jgi:ribonuclease D
MTPRSPHAESTVSEREHDLREGDVPEMCTVVACDTETTGLDWKSDCLCTCQVWIDVSHSYVVKLDGATPRVISRLMENRGITKVFHHALFDLRFLASQFGVKPVNIRCTKIASKLLDPGGGPEHTLKHLLMTRLGVKVDKSARMSDWRSGSLSNEQLRYAVNDVRYLLELMNRLQAELSEKRLWALAKACFSHIPTRVELDIGGYKDVFAY